MVKIDKAAQAIYDFLYQEADAVEPYFESDPYSIEETGN